MMKKFTLSVLSLSASVGFAFGQITVVTPNTVPSAPIQVSVGHASTNGLAVPAQGANQTWNYGSMVPTMITTETWKPESNPMILMTDLVVGPKFAELVPGYGYDYDLLLSLATGTGLVGVGRYLPAQSYSMLPVTGVASDSLSIPSQTVGNSALEMVKPTSFTYADNWQSNYRFSINALVDISGFFMMNVPTQKKTQVAVTDTVVGWGNIIMPSQSGSGTSFPVLMVKHTEVSTDSIYMNGAPAPAAMLSALNQTQGQITEQNSYIFYRQNSLVPLATFHFGNSPFTQLSEVTYHRNAGVNSLGDELAAFPVQLYPNPATGHNLNLRFDNPTAANWQFALTDVAGRLVYQQTLSNAAENQTVALPANAVNGVYLWQLSDENGNLKSAGKVSLAR